MKRVALLLDDTLSRGEVGNVAAILMGQAALQAPDIYCKQPLRDREGNLHAAILYNTIVLKASRKQIFNILLALRDQPEIIHIIFTKVGQGLHNAFNQYSAHVRAHETQELEPVGLLLFGGDNEIRSLTKKLSLLR